jgi:CBS domain-containing protein
MKVQQILQGKPTKEVATIGPEATVKDAVELFAKHSIGALPVVDESDKICGIVTERDVMRRCLRNPKPDLLTPIRAIMTTDVLVGVPDDDADYVMGVMTNNRIRHLPIVSGKTMVGIVSIGDVVKSQLKQFEFEIRHLKDYIQSGG